jgi:hypothetical protein
MAQSVRPAPVLALLASVALAAPQVALAQQQKPVAPRLTPQQQEQLFPEQKALWLKHQRARISAIQTAERCVNAARTAEAFKGCLRQERQANMALRRSHMAEMRALFGRHGIQLPEPLWQGGGQAGKQRGSEEI